MRPPASAPSETSEYPSNIFSVSLQIFSTRPKLVPRQVSSHYKSLLSLNSPANLTVGLMCRARPRNPHESVASGLLIILPARNICHWLGHCVIVT